MPITSDQAQQGTKVRIPTRKTYYPEDNIENSIIVQIAKEKGKEYLFIECVQDPISPWPHSRVTVVLKPGDSGDYFTLQDLDLY